MSNQIKCVNWLQCGAILAAALVGGEAVAQSAPTDSPASTAQAVPALGEIVVTATRRAESVQDVPVSVSAYGQSAITQLGMTNVQDITRLTPGLDMTTGNTGAPIISIRGIDSTVGTSTTGIYIDDTPIQVRFLGAGYAAASAYPVLFDLDRVEILRGPQGTLFGSSSEGGTVRFITEQPDLHAWTGHARAEASFFESGVPSSQFGIAGGGPLVDGKLGLRVSAYAEHDGGYIDLDPYPGTPYPQQHVNSQSTEALSAAFAWQPIDQVTITPAIEYQRVSAGSQNTYWPSLSDPANDRFVSGALVGDPTMDRFVLYSLRTQSSLGKVSVYSNTSYMDRADDATDDYSLYITELLTGNYTGPHVLGPVYFSNPQRQFTQEVRLQSSDPQSILHWVVGGFYQRINQRASESVVSPDLGDLTEELFGLSVPELFGVDSLPGGIIYLGQDQSQDTQVAGFAQVDFRVTSAFTVTGGVRVSHSKETYSNYQDGPFNSGPTGASGGESENDTTPKVGLTYKPTHSLMVYASAAKGFRPGGANTPVSTTLCGPDLSKLGLTSAPIEYGSDHVWSYELGTKGEAVDRRLQWDASGFLIRWSQIQNPVNLPSCGFDYIGNLGTAVSKGFDLQLAGLLTRGLKVGVALGYTRATYSRTVLGAGQGSIVTAGERLPVAPWHAAVTADYTFPPFADGAAVYAHLDGQYTTAYRTGSPSDSLYDPITAVTASTKFATARVGVLMGSWDVSAFAKNLFDWHPVLFKVHDDLASELVTESTFAPRTIGVTATYKFK